MKFKLGDHVRVTATCRWFDQVGTVADIDEPGAFHVEGLESMRLWFHPDELVLAERPEVGA